MTSREEFDVGYVQGSNIVRVCTTQDLEEIWTFLGKPHSNIAIECDGLVGGDEIQEAVVNKNKLMMAQTLRFVDTHETVQTLVDQLKD